MSIYDLLFGDSRMRIMWGVAFGVSVLTWWASRGVSWKSRGQAVQNATGIASPPGFSTFLLRLMASILLLSGAFSVILWRVYEHRKIARTDMFIIDSLVICAFAWPRLLRYLKRRL